MTKKKIIIIIIAIIFIVAVSLLLIFLKNKSVKVSNYNKEEITNSSNNENEIVENVIADTNTVESELTNTTSNNTNSNIENVENNSNASKSSIQKSTNDKTTTVSSKPSTQTASSTVEKTNTPEAIKEETPSTPQVPSTSSQQQQVPVEEYRKNDTMINKIKQVIQNNATDNMKNFGYSIVVDSSIKNQTNQFTFTESRVINAIRSKFGTIKIYAEDFYKNGQLVMTECYIL